MDKRLAANARNRHDVEDKIETKLEEKMMR
jgi:hypothetical protein